MRVDSSFRILILAGLMALVFRLSPALVSQPVRAAGEPQATLPAPIAPPKSISETGIAAATPQPPGKLAASAVVSHTNKPASSQVLVSHD
jgi:hypothetical protein